MKLSVLLMALFSFALTPAFACGGDKDGDKDEFRPTSTQSQVGTVHCGGKDDDKDE